MEYRTVGTSDLRVSSIGLGCNNFGGHLDAAQSQTVIDAAIDHGITFFDTADYYGVGRVGGSEEAMGTIFAGRRQNIVLATKFGMPMGPGELAGGASREYILRAVEASLRRLQTDWIDIYYLHWPDPDTPMEETLRALDDLITSGKVRYIGCSNLSATQLIDANRIAESAGLSKFVVCQDEYSLLVRTPEAELLPAVAASGVGLVPYFPLASGLLTGKYDRVAGAPEGARLAMAPDLAARYLTDENWAKLERLSAYARDTQHSLLSLALGWLLAKPDVPSVIAGATSPAQIAANVLAATNLPQTVVDALDAVT